MSLPGLGGVKDLTGAAKALASLATKAGRGGRGARHVGGDGVDGSDDSDNSDGSEGRGDRGGSSSSSSRGGSLHVLGRGVRADDDSASFLRFGKESHTLHGALASRGLEDSGGGDLHEARVKGLPEKGAGGGDLGTNKGIFSLDVDGGSSSSGGGGGGGGDGGDDDDDGSSSEARSLLGSQAGGRSGSSRDEHAESVSQHAGGTIPVGQTVPSYMGKANQGFMNAAGAWGAGA